MARGHQREHRRLYGRLAAFGGSILVASATLFWTAIAGSAVLAADTTQLTPAATVAPNGWTNPGNALNGSDDGVFATATVNGAEQGYRTFAIAIPDGSIIDGITVRVEAFSSDTSGCQLGVRLSGNGGSSFTSLKTQALTDVDQLVTFGSAGDTWGRVWDGPQLGNANFVLAVRNVDPGNQCLNGSTTSVDHLDVTVTYRTMATGTANAALSADVCDTADFNFVIDMSGSIGQQGSIPSNLQQVKDGINGFVDAFQAAGGDGHYAGTKFNGHAASTLTAGYVSAAAFQAKVDALSGPSGLTPTASGITTGSANNSGDRAGAPNILFVVTDGSPNVPNSHSDDLTVPETWLTGANAAIAAADAARAGSGASKYVVKAVSLSTAGDPGDVELPFSAAGDVLWAQTVMTNVGGGSYLNADFKDFAADLFKAIHCAPPPPTIEVTKTAAPTSIGEPGGNVTFSVDVHNTTLDPVKLDSLVDDVYGNLDGKGTCATGGTIAAGATYSCQFSGAVSGAPGSSHKDTVTADASNNNGKAEASDDATVTITDVLPTIVVTKSANPTSILEPGGTATFTVTVKNTSPEGVTLDSLVDNVYGDLNGLGTCATGGSIAAGDTYSCHFDGAVSGNAGSTHVDTVTAQASDNDQNSVTAKDDATVTIGDILPAITVVKTAAPTTVAEPGADVSFAVSVHNDAAEAVTLTSLVDDVYGDLDGKGTCATGGTIAPSATYTCAFTAAVSGNAGSTHHDTITAGAADDDGNSTTAHDDATVTVTDVLPTIAVDKTAFPGSIGEPGGNVTFSVKVTNNSVEPVTLDTLVDNVYGNLDGKGTCATGGTIAVGGHYDCQFVGAVIGNAGSVHTDTVQATATDDDDNTATAEDDASVTITDVPVAISVDKTASPETVPEPGATVTFSVVVANTGTETITLDSLVDDVYGDLDGKGTCAVPQTLVASATYSCHFDAAVSGDAGTVHVDTVTATGSDDDNGHASDTDDATVTVTDVLPTITVVKTASPDSLPASGGSATFSVVVTNTSVEPVTISSLVDNVYGNLDGVGSCAVGASLAPGASYSCSFTESIPATAGKHVDTVTATAHDNEDNQASDRDDATVAVAKPTPTPTGEVEGATGTPNVTPPPTDLAAAAPPSSGDGMQLTLLCLLFVGIAILVFTPRRSARARTRR